MKILPIIIVVIVGLVSLAIVFGLNEEQQNNGDTIRVAFFPNIGHIAAIVGIEHGFHEYDSTKIETKLFDSGPQVIESIFAKSIDLAYVGPSPVINGFLKSSGNDVVILAGAASGGASFIVHPNSDINSPSDFAGKRIAAPQISNSQDVSLRHFIDQHDLKSVEKGGSVIVLNISNPDIYTLFAKGDIDGAWVSEPWATLLVQELGGTRLFNEESLWDGGKFSSVLLIARSDFVKKNPHQVQQWLESHQSTTEWIEKNPDKTKLIFNKFMKDTMGKSLPEPVVDEAFDNMEITSDPLKNSIMTFAKRADSLGYLGRDGYSLEGLFYELNSEKMEG